MPRNPISKNVAIVSNALNNISPQVIAEIVAAIGSSTDPKIVAKVVADVFKKYQVKQVLTDAMLKGLTGSLAAGARLKITDIPVKSIKVWYLEKAYMADGKKFKPSINDLSRTTEIVDTVKRGMQAGNSWRKIAQDMRDKNIQVGDVAKDVQGLVDAARKSYALTGDVKGYSAYKKEIEAVKKRISRLVDPSTSKLKAAYSEFVKLTDGASAEAVERAAKYAVYHKQKYNAERIARTEMARAYGQAAHTDIAYDEDTIGWRAVLSSGHPKTDVCFSSGTRVLCAGGYKKIEEVKTNDLVLTHNFKWRKVKRVFVSSFSGSLLKLLFCNQKSKCVPVYSTPSHPFLTGEGWIPASDLKTGLSCIGVNKGTFSFLNLLMRGVLCKAKLYFLENARMMDLKKTFLELYGVTESLALRILHNYFQSFFFSNCPIDAGVYNTRHSRLQPNLDFSRQSFFGKDCFSTLRTASTCSDVATQNLDFSRRRYLERSSYQNTFENKILCFCNCIAFYSSLFLVKVFRRCSAYIVLFLSYIKYSMISALRQAISLKSVEYIPVENEIVFNLEVEKDNSYCVEGVFVHNCDFHTSVDLYGMGAGVYPKNHGPEFPFHPQCICLVDPVYTGETSAKKPGDFSEKGGEKFLNSVSDSDRRALLGVDGAEEFDRKPKTWKSNLKNWNGNTPQPATIPKEVLYGG